MFKIIPFLKQPLEQYDVYLPTISYLYYLNR